MVFVKDAEGRYVTASESLLSALSLPGLDAVIGKTDYEIFSDVELAKRYTDDDARLVESGKPLENYVEPYTPKDGRPRYCVTSKYLLRGEDGKPSGIFGVSRDVTQEYEARQSYENELHNLLSLPHDAITAVLFDITLWRVVDSRRRSESDEITSQYVTVEEYFKNAADAVVEDESVRSFFQSVTQPFLKEQYTLGNRNISMEYLRKMPSGKKHWVRTELHFMLDPVNGNLSLITVMHAIESSRRAYSELLFAAERDTMTGLLNRSSILQQIEDYLSGDGANGRHALFMIDLDNFKQVNDTFGHLSGDSVIRDSADAIRGTFRNTDLIGRMGGDEFMALMKDADSEQSVRRKAEDLIQALQFSSRSHKLELELTASVGVTLFTAGEKDLNDLYSEADAALYRSKKAGKNRFSVCRSGRRERRRQAAHSEFESVDTVHLRTLMENIDGTVAIVEASENDVRATYVSPSVYRTFDRTPNQIRTTGEGFFDFVLPEDMPGLRSALIETAKGSELLDYSYRVSDRSGVEWRHMRAKRLPEAGSGKRKLICIVTDITFLKETEESLIEAELRYRNAIEQTNALLWEVDLAKRTIKLTGPGWARFGDKPSIFENAPEGYLPKSTIHPRSYPEFRRMFSDIYRNNAGADYYFKSRLATGEWVWYQASFQYLPSEGTPRVAIGITVPAPAIDADMRRFEQELLFVNIVQGSILGYIRANLTANRLEDAAVQGDLRYDSFYGMHYTDYYTAICERFVDAEDVSAFAGAVSRDALIERFAGGNTWTLVDYRRIGMNGAHRWASLFVKLMRHPVSGDVYAFGYLCDNETARQTELKLNMPLRMSKEYLLYSPETMRQISRIVLKGEDEDRLSAVSVIELVGLERVRSDEGSLAARELLFTFGRLCRIAIGGSVIVGQFDENKISILRADAGSADIQHERVKSTIALLKELLRQAHPEADISLSGGFSLGKGPLAVYDRLLKQANIACSSAARTLGESVSAYAETGLEQAGDTDLAEKYHVLELRYQQLANMLTESENDALTGILSRHAFFRRARERIEAAPEVPYMIVRFDINRFKVFNDVHGTDAGDRLLISIASSLRRTMTEDMLCARFESDHFLVLAPYDPAAVERSRDVLAGWLKEYSPDFKLSGTVGIYRISDPTIDVSLMCDRALLALRSGKSGFETKIVYYDEALRDRLLEEQQLVDDTKTALETHQFLIYFQPQINYESGALTGAEALVRWNHPARGLLSPGTFIPLLEKNGLITSLDEYVWDETAKKLSHWRQTYGDSNVPSVSVNVSRLDIYDPKLPQKLTGILEKYSLPIDALHLEITESIYMENPQQLIDTVRELRLAGFTVEMDDFGSGYSSLNTLKDVPVDTLKLDMKFLAECSDSTRGGNILSSVIRMAHWLKIPVIAEGVESRDQADYLKSLNCVYMQGYYFAKPMPEQDFIKLIASREIGVMDRYRHANLEGVAAFWDASAQTELIFNSFVGGAAILERQSNNVSIVRANDRFYAEIGTTREKYLDWQLRILDSFDEKNAGMYLAMLERAASTDSEAEMDVESLPQQPGGEPFWTHNRVRLLARNGDMLLYYLSVENITPRKMLEKEREAEEERTNLLMETTGVSFFDYDVLTDVCSYRTYLPDRGLAKLTVPQFYRALANASILDEQGAELIRRRLETIESLPVSGQFECRADLYRTGLRWCNISYAGVADAEGRVYRLVGQIDDIQQRKDREAIAASVRQRLNAKTIGKTFNDAIVGEIFGLFYESGDITGAIETTLSLLGETFDLSRVYIFEEADDRESMSNTFEWCAEGVTPLISNMQQVLYAEVGGREAYLGVFDEGGAFCCPDTEYMPSGRKTFVKPQGVQSLLQCAIRDNGVYAGMIGFDECRENRIWTDEQVGTLLFVSRIIGAFLVKLRRSDSAAFSADFRAALDDNASFLYIIDPESYEIIYCNRAIIEDSGADHVGSTCYREFMNGSEPCANCPVRAMHSDGQSHIAEVTRADGVTLLAQSSHLRWNGRSMAMLFCIDITKSKQAEHALIAEKQKTDLAIAAANLVLWTYNYENDSFFLAKNNAELLGVNECCPGAYRAAVSQGLVMPDSVDEYIALHERLLSGESTVSAVIHFNPKALPYEWLHITYSAAEGGGAAIAIGQDVTAQKHAEKLFLQEAEYRRTLGSDYLLTLRINLSKDTVEDIQSLELSNPDAMLGAHRDGVVPHFAESIPDPAEREKFLAFFSVKRLLAANERGETELTYPYTGLDRDGARRSLLLDVRLMKRPGDGDVIAFLSVRDQSSEILLKRIMTRIIDTGYDYIATIDSETGYFKLFATTGGRDSVLPASGPDFERAVGDAAAINADKAEAKLVVREIQIKKILAALETESEYVCTYRTKAERGARVLRLVFRTLTSDAKQLLLTRQDVTKLVSEEHENSERLTKALMAAKDASAAKGEFLSQISHDIRTPLNAVIGLTTLALERPGIPADVTEYLNMIDSSGRVLQGLISDILDMSKIERRVVELHPVRYESREFHETLLSAFRPLCDKKRIELTVADTPGGGLPLTADKARFNQIFFNILSNAVRFTDAGGRITYAAENASLNDGLLSCDFVVRDTGCGIGADFLPRVFEPFSQEKRFGEAEFAGSGLGLTIAKSLVDLMGGTITLSSEIDRGTEVRVRLTLPVDRTPEKTKKSGAPAADQRLEGRSILLAEDVPVNAKIIEKLAESAGARVTLAVNGEEAVAAFSSAAPDAFDAVIMDIFMPVMDGLEAARRIRSLDRADARRVPIVALSANAFEKDRMLSTKAGMDAHLTKPVDRRLLIDTLASLIEKRT